MTRVGKRETVLLVLVLALAGAGLAFAWLSGREGAARASGEEAVVAPPLATAPGPGASERAVDRGERRTADAITEAMRELPLLLQRLPDLAPLANVVVDVQPRAAEDGDEDWLATASDGRVRVKVPAGARSLRVLAPGFEPAEAALVAGPEELVVRLTPSSGLFGRVLLEDGAPASGASVELLVPQRRAHLDLDPRRPEPLATVRELPRLLANARTSAEGWYYLACDTRRTPAQVRVQATLGALAATATVELPRASAALADLELAPPAERLVLRVIDEEGRPVEGATIHSFENPIPSERSLTDEHGELVIASPRLPSAFSAFQKGLELRELRHDGEVVPINRKVESCKTRVELVLAPFRGVRVRIVDAETRLPLFLVRGQCELSKEGRQVGRSDFEADSEGVAWVSFTDRYQMSPTHEAPDLARLTVNKEGYEPEQVFELDPRAPPAEQPVELALRPLPGFLLVRGRVVRAGEPLPRFQVGLKVQPRIEDPERRTWKYGRAYTDDQGRFALRFEREAAEQVVTVYPHWFQWDEFGFIGPMTVAEATAEEHVLALQPAERVPALLRGVVPGEPCFYYVALAENGVVVPTTINGVPIAVETEGEMRTLLRLPPGRRVEIKLGRRTENSIYTDGSAPVIHDPSHPELPLVFELTRTFFRVRGRVAGFTDQELSGLGVALRNPTDQEARETSLASLLPGGTFEVQARKGEYELFLIQAKEGSWASTILARMPVSLQRDLDDVVLAPDPASVESRR